MANFRLRNKMVVLRSDEDVLDPVRTVCVKVANESNNYVRYFRVAGKEHDGKADVPIFSMTRRDATFAGRSAE